VAAGAQRPYRQAVAAGAQRPYRQAVAAGERPYRQTVAAGGQRPTVSQWRLVRNSDSSGTSAVL